MFMAFIMPDFLATGKKPDGNDLEMTWKTSMSETHPQVAPLLRPGGLREVEAALGEALTFVSAPTELRPAEVLGRVSKEKSCDHVLLVLLYLCVWKKRLRNWKLVCCFGETPNIRMEEYLQKGWIFQPAVLDKQQDLEPSGAEQVVTEDNLDRQIQGMPFLNAVFFRSALNLDMSNSSIHHCFISCPDI